MADCFSKEKRSWVMSRIRGADTGPERVLRRLLHSKGLRFRTQKADLPGKPDLVLKKYHALIYVHGCFWHGHRCQAGRKPRSNLTYWHQKLERNKRRDRIVARACRRLGWKRIVVWECQLRDLDRVERRVFRILKGQH